MAYVNRNLNEMRTRNALIAGTATTALGVLLVTALTFNAPGHINVFYPPATNPTLDQPPPQPQPKPESKHDSKPVDHPVTTVKPDHQLVGQLPDDKPFMLPPIDLNGTKGGAGGEAGTGQQAKPPFVSKARGLIGAAGNTIGPGDYLSRSINLGEHGTTLATFTVGVNGQVTACTTDGQPSKALAAETCRIIMSRFRFQPALDDEGHGIAQTKTQRVSWVLPDE
jgi:protein TonB